MSAPAASLAALAQLATSATTAYIEALMACAADRVRGVCPTAAALVVDLWPWQVSARQSPPTLLAVHDEHGHVLWVADPVLHSPDTGMDVTGIEDLLHTAAARGGTHTWPHETSGPRTRRLVRLPNRPPRCGPDALDQPDQPVRPLRARVQVGERGWPVIVTESDGVCLSVYQSLERPGGLQVDIDTADEAAATRLGVCYNDAPLLDPTAPQG